MIVQTRRRTSVGAEEEEVFAEAEEVLEAEEEEVEVSVAQTIARSFPANATTVASMDTKRQHAWRTRASWHKARSP